MCDDLAMTSNGLSQPLKRASSTLWFSGKSSLSIGFFLLFAFEHSPRFLKNSLVEFGIWHLSNYRYATVTRNSSPLSSSCQDRNKSFDGQFRRSPRASIQPALSFILIKRAETATLHLWFATYCIRAVQPHHFFICGDHYGSF